jgi:hypothetical protein
VGSVSILGAAQSGDRWAALEAMRDKLAAAMDIAEPQVIAQVAGRLSAVLQELEGRPVEEASVSDQLADRRARRRSTSEVGEAPAAESVKRRRGGGAAR